MVRNLCSSILSVSDYILDSSYRCCKQTHVDIECGLTVLQGKTDVAMLTVLRVLDQHRSRSDTSSNIAATIDRDKFKIIYVYVNPSMQPTR